MTAFEAVPLIKPPALRGVSDFQTITYSTFLSSASGPSVPFGAGLLGTWIVLRGLAFDPAARHPSMDALLAA